MFLNKRRGLSSGHCDVPSLEDYFVRGPTLVFHGADGPGPCSSDEKVVQLGVQLTIEV